MKVFFIDYFLSDLDTVVSKVWSFLQCNKYPWLRNIPVFTEVNKCTSILRHFTPFLIRLSSFFSSLFSFFPSAPSFSSSTFIFILFPSGQGLQGCGSGRSFDRKNLYPDPTIKKNSIRIFIQ